MSVQTRSEEHGLRQFDTLKEAITHALQDASVWKVSFSLEGGERVRLVRTPADEWVFEPLI